MYYVIVELLQFGSNREIQELKAYVSPGKEQERKGKRSEGTGAKELKGAKESINELSISM